MALGANENRAVEALRSFHQRAAALYAPAYTYTFDELVAYFRALNPFFLDTFGKALGYATDPNVSTSLSQSTVRSIMERIADRSGGKLPARPGDLSVFYEALTDQYGTWSLANWTRIASAAAVDTAKDVATVAAVGLGGLALYGLVAVVVFALARGGRK